MNIAGELGITDANNKCPQEMKWENAVNNVKISFKGEKAFNRIKSMEKQIKKEMKKCNKNRKTLTNLMNEAVWRKE